MNKNLKTHSLLLIAALITLSGCNTSSKFHQREGVNFSQVRITDRFFAPRLDKHATATLGACIDQIENKTGRMKNFENAALGHGEHSGIFFDDSDVYKALEGIAYSLINNPNTQLEAKADEWIDKIAAAQQSDGYINTFYTIAAPDKRWTDMDKHEMYCAGHMTEAAIAYCQATGKRKLLDVAIRMADHMIALFGPDKRHWVPGHEEIELAMMKLYSFTGEQRYADFAHWLLEERGHGYGTGANGEPWNRNYYQDEVPVGELTDICGHAVRAMYLFCGMADVSSQRGDMSYMPALNRLWEDVVERNMYITGGIGSSRSNEGFTTDYDLPNTEAYCETCASVGMVLWNYRMFLLTGCSQYVDVLEKALYNAALAGLSLSGDKFFYVNPLYSNGNHHRKAWYGCACCPSQISRFLPSLGSYLYAVANDTVWVNLYIDSSAEVEMIGKKTEIIQRTDYPWNGKVEIELKSHHKGQQRIELRKPAWCKTYTVELNDTKVDFVEKKGYIELAFSGTNNVVTFTMDMPVEVVAADPRVKVNEGMRAIQRGPIIYCMEQVDNSDFDTATLTSQTEYVAHYRDNLLGGVESITASNKSSKTEFIPYYAWDNRQGGKMQVWVPYSE